MRLPPELYHLYKDAKEVLDHVKAPELTTCFVTINKMGEIEAHDDELFDDGPHWFCYGNSQVIGYHKVPDEGLPDEIWHLLKRRVDL